MKYYLFTTLAFILLTGNFTAQNTGESELGSWYEITSSNRISDKLSISGSLTNWNYELPAEKSQLMLGIVGLNYHLNKNVTVGIGYAKGDIDSSFEENDVPNIKENRILEQISAKHKSNNIAWSHRLRLEQRFLEYPTEDKLKHRVRYRFKGKLPINKTLFISAYDEIHFNLNEFDFHQNRAYAGLGAKLNKNINVELGYARHSFKTKSFNRLSLQLNLKYDFRKEKI
jgi:hypothetical protein